MAYVPVGICPLYTLFVRDSQTEIIKLADVSSDGLYVLYIRRDDLYFVKYNSITARAKSGDFDYNKTSRCCKAKA